MATVGNANNSSYLNTSRLSYISIAEFSNNIFTYTTTTANFNTTGKMTSFATQGLSAPKGHVLRENGRKYIPGANPAAPGFNTYMVGVYDNQTMQSGFIDPNGPQFAIYNTDKPNFLPDGVDPVGGLTDHGAPVYTNSSVEARTWITADTGDITALLGNIIATVGHIIAGTYITAGTYISAGTTVTAGGVASGSPAITATLGDIVATSGQIRSANVTSTTLPTSTGPTYTFDPRTGQIFTVLYNNSAGNTTPTLTLATTLANIQTGQIVYLAITNTVTYTVTIAAGTGMPSLLSGYTIPNNQTITAVLMATANGSAFSLVSWQRTA